MQTPAVSAPCGTGWPCAHCDDGWFCVPSPQTVGAAMPQASSTSSVVVPNAYPATNHYQYAGCFQDTSNTILRDAQLMEVASGMTNDQCVTFCQSQSFAIAGTKSGTQCFCGNDLSGSAVMSSEQCNMTCAGDTMESTVCGGPGALSVWSFDSSFQHAGLSSGEQSSLSLATIPSPQETGAIAYTKMLKSIYSWPSTASSAGNSPIPLATSDLSELEMAMLSVIASKAQKKQGTAAQGFIGSISSVLNMGMSSIAHDVPLANLTTSTAFNAASSSISLVPKPTVPLTVVPTAATLYMTASTGGTVTTRTPETNGLNGDVGAIDASTALNGNQVSPSIDGADVDDTDIVPTLYATTKKERRAPRRRAHWA